MAVILITHDIGVVERMADRVGVMYAGRIVEEGTAGEVLSSPQHPYTPRPHELGTEGGQAIPGACSSSTVSRRDPAAMPPGCPLRTPLRRAGALLRRGRARTPARCARPVRPLPPQGLYAAGGRRRGSTGGRPGMPRTIIETRSVCRDIPIKEGLLFLRQVGVLQAVNDVSIAVHEGETLALVGQSGAGKTTLGMMMLGLIEPTSGEVVFEGQDVYRRRQCQVSTPVYDGNAVDFSGSPCVLEPPNTRRKIDRITAHEPRMGQGGAGGKESSNFWDMVGLNPSHHNRYPHQFSGGQAQKTRHRARALGPDIPKFIVLDEPVSALDVTIPGPDHQPAEGPPGQARLDLPVHRAQP